MTRKSRSGPSGRPLTHAEQLARGRVRVVVWLDEDDAGRLAALEALDPRAEGARSRAVRQAILAAYEAHSRTTPVHVARVPPRGP
jgi:hypothetical protein